MQALRVEGADDVREVRLLLATHGDREGIAHRGRAELREHLGDRLTLVGVGRPRLHCGAPDLSLELLRRPLGDDVAAVDDPDPVGEHVRLLQVLGGEEDGHALAFGEPCDLTPERAAALGIKAGCRLVEEERGRLVDERERQVEPALHSARVALDLAVGGARQPDALEKLLAAALSLLAREAMQGSLESQVLAAGQKGVECGLLQGGADRRAHLRALLDDVESRHARGARGGWQERRQHVHRGRLPRAVRAEEAEDLPGRDAQVDPVHGLDPALVLARQLLGLDAVFIPHGEPGYLCRVWRNAARRLSRISPDPPYAEKPASAAWTSRGSVARL